MVGPRGSKYYTSQQNAALQTALDVRRAVCPFAVADGEIDDGEIEPRGAEEQVEVAERVEVPEVAAVGGQLLVVVAAQHLGAAQGVLDRLPQQPREGQPEELVPQEVREAHRLPFHGV